MLGAGPILIPQILADDRLALALGRDLSWRSLRVGRDRSWPGRPTWGYSQRMHASFFVNVQVRLLSIEDFDRC
jgi:hypothetical protein